MFEKITPEQAGISSKNVLKFFRSMEKHGVVMHSMLLMKGDKLFAEGYYAPFDVNFCHRMYSETKSYVGIAVGLLEEDGKIDLDEKIATYFPDKYKRELPPYLAKQTVRQMLTMTTSVVGKNWFAAEESDRTALYLNEMNSVRPAGTLWEYDSPGSQVLCSLVERVSGKSLFDFLNERIFSHLGTFKNATILKTKTEDSWGDSALVCTPRDMASFARFLLNYGTWQGKRLMNEEYIRKATTKQVDNLSHDDGHTAYASRGYGYQIWCTEEDGFAFNGMGGQFMIAVPKKDLIFVCTGDNQGGKGAAHVVFNTFFDQIVDEMHDEPIPEDPDAYLALEEKLATLKLAVIAGDKESPYQEKINGVWFACKENPMGITRFSFAFNGNRGEFRYTNAQGDKVLPFGLGCNVFDKFPEDGYSDGHGGLPGPLGFRYQCATSAAWGEERKLNLMCRVIDRYFGNLYIMVSWTDDGQAYLVMRANAENFLQTYRGEAIATPEN